MLHPDSDHEYDEEIKRSLTSTSSLVESESEEGHDRRHGHVFDSDETTVNDAVTNPNTTASVVTENNDTADGHIFDGIVSRGIGNITLESNQYNVGEGNLRDNTSDLSADDTLHNTATEGDFTETVVGRNASNICQSPAQERPHTAIIIFTSTTIDLTRNMMTMKSSTRRFTILWNGIWEILY